MLKKTALASVIFALTAPTAFASDFNNPFINASGLGEVYAGWAAVADDASTAASNPAGLTHIHHQEFVGAPIAVDGHTTFTGITTAQPTPVGTANSSLGGQLVSLFYSTPINDKIYFALAETVPFAFGTSFANDSILRYAGTKSQIVVIDLSPNLGFQVTDNFSVGLGFDADRIKFTLNNMYGPALSPGGDSEVWNHLAGWGYGYHVGLLYDFTPCTRVGLSHHSQMMTHTKGDSEVFGPFGRFKTTAQRSDTPLPALTQLSLYHDLNSEWAVMGTLFYTNWASLNQIVLQNTMIPFGVTVPVTIPFNYHNTFDYAVGGRYQYNNRWRFSAGLEYLNAPSNDFNRSATNPLGPYTIAGLGAHYQQSKTLSYDIGYNYCFFQKTNSNATNPISMQSGSSELYSNALGLQITWNIG